MKKNKQNDRKYYTRLEYICIAVIAVLFCVAGGVIVWWKSPVFNAGSADSASAASVADQNLMQQVSPGTSVSDVSFSDADGNAVALSEYKGTPVVLIFWGSWCKYCKEQFATADELEYAAENCHAKIILVDKLDVQKDETKEKAVQAEADLGLNWPLLFDDGLSVYHSWGLLKVPTFVLIDSDGLVTTCHSGTVNTEEFQDLLSAFGD